MTIEDHLSTFHGLPVVDYSALMERGEPLPEPDAVAWRLAVDPSDWYHPREDGFDGYDAIWEDFLAILTDTGAEALLDGQPLTHLARLDLHHHFVGQAMSERLHRALEPAGVVVDLSEPQVPEGDEDDPWFYVAVSE